MARDRWSALGEVALVVGATYPTELARVRGIVGDMPLLVPGIGAQGGDVDATVTAGRDSRGFGMMINSSRAILYASNGDDWAAAAREAAEATRDQIRAVA
jgi:orotidine-5'-phosphate decarboxylase